MTNDCIQSEIISSTNLNSVHITTGQIQICMVHKLLTILFVKSSRRVILNTKTKVKALDVSHFGLIMSLFSA